MPSVACPLTVRHGKCRLVLVINGKEYVLSTGKAAAPRHKLWRLKGVGSLYSVCYGKGDVSCSCPDSWRVGHQCKHIGALKALGLIPRAARVPQPVPLPPPPAAGPVASLRRAPAKGGA